MRLAIGLLLISTLALSTTSCSQLGAASGSSDNRTATPGGSGGVLSKLRPHADPAMIAQMRQEDLAKAQQAQAEAERLAQATQDGIGRILPRVSTDPIAPAGDLGAALAAGAADPAVVAPTAESGWGQATTAANVTAASTEVTSSATPAIPQIAAATYGANYGVANPAVPPPPPGALSGGSMVPPPPAVTLSTQANLGQAGYPPPAPYPYAAYPYPYPQQMGYPMQPQQMMPGQEAAPAQPQRPALFGNKTSGSSGDEEKKVERPKKEFIPIAPVGMEPRSPYKQRDDLRILWKGLLASSGMRQVLNKDDKLADLLNRTDVGLPTESTKGSFSVSQRQIDAVFKAVPIDKKVQPLVRQKQQELVQAYYRYLHAYNRFALEQQTVAARKQEVEVASSDAEKQRAAADLARAQNDADATKEDMKTAQYELAAAAGANAARSVIAKVANIAPSIESLAQAEASQAPQETNDGGVLASARSFFFGGRGKEKNSSPPAEEPKKQKEPKEKVAKKDKSTNKKSGEKGGDLTPAPQTASAEPASKDDSSSGGEAPSQGSAISFELKGVNITARKSILSVSIKNNGSDSFSFSPEVISVAENNKKLSEAALRADFDQTLVKPNEEVKGTITIFGRPWNDKLAVFISDGGKNIQLRR